MLEVYLKKKTPGQLGGLPARQSLIATHTLRIHGQLAKHHKLTSAVIFLDVKGILHHMLREWVYS